MDRFDARRVGGIQIRAEYFADACSFLMLLLVLLFFEVGFALLRSRSRSYHHTRTHECSMLPVHAELAGLGLSSGVQFHHGTVFAILYARCCNFDFSEYAHIILDDRRCGLQLGLNEDILP